MISNRYPIVTGSGETVGREISPVSENRGQGSAQAAYTSEAAEGSLRWDRWCTTGRKSNLEYDFVVQAGADASQIRFRFNGASQVRVTEDGSLSREVNGRQWQQKAPLAFQQSAQRFDMVKARYVVSDGGEVSLALGDYDRGKELVIDPVLTTFGNMAALVFTSLPAGVSVSQASGATTCIDPVGSPFVVLPGGVPPLASAPPTVTVEFTSTGVGVFYIPKVASGGDGI